ncbi:MAG: alpha-amylase [Anaerolineae bacterium]|nr:alpha-amylase [Anaerolineae bacterium]
MAWPRFPIIYEINTWTWLHRLSAQSGDRAPITLANVPAEELDRLAGDHFDAIWLMGVWQRSPAGAEIARAHPGLQAEYRRALPDFTSGDVVGSPYAIRRYEVDARLGGAPGLAAIREQFAARDMRLILDFVPNHLAVDHPDTLTNPQHFMQGDQEDLANFPDRYFTVEVDGKPVIYAHGRDPYFPPWTDTVQLNTARIAVRRATVEVLRGIAGQCDGVRCDMAMLPLNAVFQRTWGKRGKPDTAAINDDFWEFVIPPVRKTHPGFLFIAEAYWNLEWELQQQGFDYVYDKTLYDRLRADDARGAHDHLRAELAYQARLVRFIENHDEPRALPTFGPGLDRAAAVLICTVPGARLLHDGQLEGRRIKMPVQLGRAPDEPVHADLPAFYGRLLKEISRPVYQDGAWALLDIYPAWHSNSTHSNLTACAWTHGAARRLAVVNLRPQQSQAHIHLPWDDLGRRTWVFNDVMNGVAYERDGEGLNLRGLYVDLPPYGYHVFYVKAK